MQLTTHPRRSDCPDTFDSRLPIGTRPFFTVCPDTTLLGRVRLSQGIRWLDGMYIIAQKAVPKVRVFKPIFPVRLFRSYRSLLPFGAVVVHSIS